MSLGMNDNVAVGGGPASTARSFKTLDDVDMQMLRNIRRTAGRSQQIVGELKNLKAKVYGMENDLRHL